MTYCETCGHQFSDVCGGCESLEGVPVKYSEKEIDKAAEAIIEKIARKLSNDILFGMNRKGTNADGIRCMTDEELAEWISNQGVDCAYCRIESLCYEECKCGDCKKAWLKWLKQEVSDDS